MSLCDVCLDPGACCKRMFLTSGSGRAEAPMSFEAAEHFAMRNGLPFRPAEQLEDGSWTWTCNQLTEEGRCGIYDDRPQLCRDYLPGSSPLCVHWHADPREIFEAGFEDMFG